MIKISLHHLKFHAFHGLYEEEKKTGNDFEVNLDAYFEETANPITHLNQTINYAVLYNMVKERMNMPEPLLETIAMDIALQAKAHFPIITEINVSVRKIKPPMLNFQGQTEVSFHKKYNQ
ncbi:MAG: dihydroneopterin aldolase [Agriterribacter sp.]